MNQFNLENVVEDMNRINKAIYGVEPYKVEVQNPDDASDNDEPTIERGE